MGNIYESITAIMADVEAIGKNKKNTQQGFMFRGIDDIYNTLHPLLAKHGVFTLPEVLEEKTEERQTKNGGTLIYRIMKIKYHFCASDGSRVEAVVIGEGMDSGDKAGNKAMSIAHKYAFFQVFAIPTEELIDPDGDTPPESVPKSNNGTEVGEVSDKIKTALEKVPEEKKRNQYRDNATKAYRAHDVEKMKGVLNDIENYIKTRKVFTEPIQEDIF